MSNRQTATYRRLPGGEGWHAIIIAGMTNAGYRAMLPNNNREETR